MIKQTHKMTALSVLIPAYNEEKTLEEIVDRVQRVNLPVKKEVIIVNDASTDNTQKIINNLRKKYKNIKSFSHKRNFGKGKAIKTGLKEFSGDIVVIQDADLEYNPEDYKKMIKPILNGKAEAVYGSRFLNLKYRSLKLFGEQKTPMPLHYLGNKFLSFLTKILYGQKITDMETCYKMMTRKVAKNLKLKSNRFNIEPEITAKIIKNKNKILEVPIQYKARTFQEGKKITWKDGFIALYTLLKYRLFK